MSDREVPYQRGDVVFGADPFNNRDAPRPWLILSDESHPFYGQQYVGVTLTSKQYHEKFYPLDDADWERGGMPEDSNIVPWGIGSLDHDDFDHNRHHGRLNEEAVTDIAKQSMNYVLGDSDADE